MGEIVLCSRCGAKNRIPAERKLEQATCGKCHAPLAQAESPNSGTRYIMRCGHCGTKNRIASDRIEDAPQCGKCSKILNIRELFAPQPMTVGDADFDHKVIAAPIPVLLFAWAPWCSTCNVVAPHIDQFAQQSLGKIRVCKVNVGTHPALGTRLDVMSVPHLFVFDRGRQVESMPGALDRNELMMKMARYVY